MLAEQEGALGVRVCAYTRWRSCPAAELRHWVCSVVVLVPPVAGTRTYELPGLTANNPHALICRDTQVFASSHSWPSETHSKPLAPSRFYFPAWSFMHSHETHNPNAIPKCPSLSSHHVPYTPRQKHSLVGKVMRGICFLQLILLASMPGHCGWDSPGTDRMLLSWSLAVGSCLLLFLCSSTFVEMGFGWAWE